MEPENVFDTYLLPMGYNQMDENGSQYEKRPFDTHLFELYHENSKNNENTETSSINKKRLKLIHERPCRSETEGYELPETGEDSLSSLIEERESVREFNDYDVDIRELSKLLKDSVGGRKKEEGIVYTKYPSAGALYPVDIYWLNMSKNELGDGKLVRYDAENNRLEIISEEGKVDFLLDETEDAIDFENLAGCFILTGRFWRSTIKYGERGYRYTLIESGHIAQNISLVVRNLGLDTIPIGGFVDRKVEELLGIDGVEESVLYIIGVGKNG